MHPFIIVLKDAFEIQEGNRTRRKLQQMLENAGVDTSQVTVTYIDASAQVIEKNNPKVIVTMGAEAFKSLYKDGEGNPIDQPLGTNRGELLEWVVPCLDCDNYSFDHKYAEGSYHDDPRQARIPLIPTYHPNFVYRNWSDQETIEYDLRKAWQVCQSDTLPMTTGNNYSVVLDLDTLRDVAEYIKNSKYCAFDIETEGFDTFDQDEILCVQFSTQPGEGIVVPLRGAWLRHEEDYYSPYQLEHYFWRWAQHKDGTIEKVLSKTETGAIKVAKPAFPAGSIVCSQELLHTDKSPAGHHCRGILTDIWAIKDQPREYYAFSGRMSSKPVPIQYNEVARILKDIFENSDTIFIAYNGKFDVRGLRWQLGINVHHFLVDGILQYHQFHEEFPHNLEFVRSRFTFMPKYDNDLKSYLPKEGASFAMVPNEVLWYYGACDADLEFRITSTLDKYIEEDNPENGNWIFQNIDMPYNRALLRIEDTGIKVDMQRFYELSEFYQQAIIDTKTELDTLLKEHEITTLDSYSNNNSLRLLLYENQYEIVISPKKESRCKECKGNGILSTESACDRCNATGMVTVAPQITKICQGLGLPEYIVPRTETTDEAKTDKKAFTALLSWCSEKVKYTQSEYKGRLVRKPTAKPLSQREINHRLWKKKALKLILQYKQALQARNLFLEGDPSKEIDGETQAMLSHIKYDGKIHPEFKQLTTTARLSCANPNLQNIANEDDEVDADGEKRKFHGYGIRTMFVVEE